ncbi:MAG: hypothetical protein ACRCYS_14935 [Beijerinckiaceae bacterium]
MADLPIPPTPRSNIIGYVGGQGGTPVYADRVWQDYWVRQLLARFSADGLSLNQIQDSVFFAIAQAQEADQQAAGAMAVAVSARSGVRSIEVPEPLWNSIVSRIIRLERHVAALEEMPL